MKEYISKENLKQINFKDLIKIWNKTDEILENFENQPKIVAKVFYEATKKQLNEIYNNPYKKDLGLVEGYNLDLHTKIVINQFAKFYPQFKEVLQNNIFNLKDFLTLLTIHDIGKVDEEVQELKKNNVAKKIWKNKEIEKTEEMAKEILGNLFSKDQNKDKKNSVALWLLGEGSQNFGALLNNFYPVDKFTNEIKEITKITGGSEEKIFDLLEMYLACDASAYTSSAISDFENEINQNTNLNSKTEEKGKEKKYEKIKKRYDENGEGGPGNGVNKWFKQSNNEIKFTGKFKDLDMEKKIQEIREKLK